MITCAGAASTQVVLAGIATSAGVESTARSAYDLGYNVALVVDAMTDRDADAHRHCVEKDLSADGRDGQDRGRVEAAAVGL